MPRTQQTNKPATPSNQQQVLLVTIKFKKRILMTNEFTVRLATTEFNDTFTVEQLLCEGYRKHKETALLGTTWLLQIPQRILGYGKYIGFRPKNILAVYTEKDKGRISLSDIAKHILVHNEVVVCEYYDKNLVMGTGAFLLGGLLYFGYHLRKYIRYRIHRGSVLPINNW